MQLSRRAFGATAIAGAVSLAAGRSRAAADKVKIGVLTDMSGSLSAVLGTGSVDGTRMAVEDFGGSAAGMPVEVVFADHQNKADVGSAIARRWLDQDGVDVITDLGNSAVAIASQSIVKEKNKIIIISGASSSDLTGKFCNPNSFHWGYDTYMFSAGLASELTLQGGNTWFFLTADYAFGHALETDATRKVEELGGKVLGRARYPINTLDMASLLLQAQTSGAKVIGLVASGDDLERFIKQGNEFGIWRKQKAAAFGLQLYNVMSIGVESMQGIVHNSIFYWDRDDKSRDFGRRFWKRNSKPPSEAHAIAYSAATQYLKAVRAAGTKDTATLLKVMHELPVDDLVTPGGKVRVDGRLIRPTWLLEVKPKDQIKEGWDAFSVVREIPGEKAFRPLSESACPLVKL
ncbi:ABC transporter substrate-binding protein [Bradyrhizobium sp. LHD-71]|uniref:ABC transporter substrate-binding protein n=1 Tax=Bradyrhizobium sp. LHD-71 TaxID=3072141 RepID=UPI00280E294C|nr:ABC transporter substrate-binding protein [Bradyrhizobium sp. LHD-71]MDQ8727978.1 ABC transporter substrate-binding protein [Bradyrhizobium sp. LHD-71]